jgi:hypothetical protein
VPGERQSQGTLSELAFRSLHQPILYSMRRRPKTPEELRADLKIFEAAWKREMTQFLRNASARMVSGGSYGRMPAKYKMKLPRLTTTVVEPSSNPGPRPTAPRRPSEQTRSCSRSRPRKNPLPPAGESRRSRAAEKLELRRLLHNTVERMKALRDGRPMPARYEVTFSDSADATAMETVRSFQDFARSAADRLLNPGWTSNIASPARTPAPTLLPDGRVILVHKADLSPSR